MPLTFVEPQAAQQAPRFGHGIMLRVKGVSAQGAATGDLGQQGAAIPLIYGEVLTQAVPISVVSTVEDIPVYSDQYGSIEAAFNHFWYGYQ